MRLRRLRRKFRVASAFIAEYALDLFLAEHTNEDIADLLRALGYGLRRAKGGSPHTDKIQIHLSGGSSDRLADLHDRGRIAEAFVVEYALKHLLSMTTDDALAARLHERGLGLRRSSNRGTS